jgi:hypothetical protein
VPRASSACRGRISLAVRDEALDAFAEGTASRRRRAGGSGRPRAAVDDAEEAGALPGFLASLAREAADAVPPWLLLEALERLGSFLP